MIIIYLTYFLSSLLRLHYRNHFSVLSGLLILSLPCSKLLFFSWVTPKRVLKNYIDLFKNCIWENSYWKNPNILEFHIRGKSGFKIRKFHFYPHEREANTFLLILPYDQKIVSWLMALFSLIRLTLPPTHEIYRERFVIK